MVNVMLIDDHPVVRAGLRAIRQAVEQARQAGMISQQLARLAAGR